MAICFHEEKRIFQLDTKNSTYLIGLTPEGYLSAADGGSAFYSFRE